MQVKIVERRRVATLQPERLGADDVLIGYQVPGGSIYFIRVPAEKADEEAIRQAIKTDVEARAAIVGKDLEI